MTSGPPAQALATHLINQTLASISLLETLSLISPSDASLIRSKLPNPYGPFNPLASSSSSSSISASGPNQNQNQNASPDINTSFQTLSVASGPISPIAQNTNSYQTSHAPSLPPRHTPRETRAKALWDYSGTEADDLRFRAGDVIIVDEEVNPQWSRGRVIPSGQVLPLEKGGLFPSNYIEKLQSDHPYQSPPPDQAMVPYQGQNSYYNQNQNPNQIQIMMAQPLQPQQQTMVMQEGKQHGRFGKVGQNLGNAAVAGAGFGFGSAIASDLVNKTGCFALVHAIFHAYWLNDDLLQAPD